MDRALPELNNPPKTTRGARTVRKLLDAAQEEFGSKGFHEASVAGITTAAGTAQGTVYIYFKSKEELFRTLVFDLGRRLRDFLGENVDAEADRLTAEAQGMTAFIRFVRLYPNLYRIVLEAQFVDPEAFRLYFQDFGAAYRTRCEAAAARGEIRLQDADAESWALMGISLFLGLRYGIWEAERDPAPVVDSVMDMIGNGLKPRPGEEGSA